MRMVDLLTELGEAFEDIKRENDQQAAIIKAARAKMKRRR